jgi:serine O-acetyltransferase
MFGRDYLRAARRRITEDINAVRERDPAADGSLMVLLCYPGLHALWLYRIAHRCWLRGHPVLARVVTQTARLATGVEIHPAAEVGRRVVIDHGIGVVVGATAEIGEDVLIYHGVTLGSRAPNAGKRHPTVGDGVLLGANATLLGPIEVGENATVGDGVLLGANATLLGPIEVGENATVGAAAVVVDSVDAGTTVVGNPARPVGATHLEGDGRDDADPPTRTGRVVCDGGDPGRAQTTGAVARDAHP